MISVVIPVYNAAALVTRAVESAVTQAQVSEVLLVEDGSTDDSYRRCQELAVQWPQVRLLENDARHNLGAAEARNRGWRAARSELIAFLDADDFYLPGRFDGTIKVLDDQACAGVYESVAAQFESPAAQQAFLDQRGHSLVQSDDGAWITRIRPGLAGARLYAELVAGRAGFCHLNGLTVRRWALELCGGFDPRLRVHQDLHLLIRLAYLAQLRPGADRPVAVRWVHANNRITAHGRLGKLPLRRVLFIDLLRWAVRQRLPRADIRALIKRLWACYRLLPTGSKHPLLRRLSYLPLSAWLLLRYPGPMLSVLLSQLRPGWTPAGTAARGCRVAVFVNEFPSTSETFVADHIESLANHGFEVWVFARRRAAGLNGPISARLGDRVRVHARPEWARNRWKRWLHAANLFVRLLARSPLAAWRLARFGRANWTAVIHHASVALAAPSHFHVLHVHSGHTAQAFLPLFTTGLLQGPLAVTFHGYDYTRHIQGRSAAYYAPLFNAARRLYGCSDFTLSALRDLGAPANKLLKVRNGVVVEKLEPLGEGLRECGNEELRLLSVGRLVPFKGYADGLAVVRILRDNGLKVRWSIIGDGPLMAALQQQAKDLSLGDAVSFLGALPRAQVLLQMLRADLYLYTGIVDDQGAVETQGVALLEAQACALPVVATRVGGVPETLADGVGGVLVVAADRAAIAQAVMDLAADPEGRRQLGEAGRQRILREFDLALQQQRLLADYGALQVA